MSGVEKLAQDHLHTAVSEVLDCGGRIDSHPSFATFRNKQSIGKKSSNDRRRQTKYKDAEAAGGP